MELFFFKKRNDKKSSTLLCNFYWIKQFFISLYSYKFFFDPRCVFYFTICGFIQYIVNKKILNYSYFKSALSSFILILLSFLLGILFSKTIISTSSFYLGLLSYMIYIAFLLKKVSNIKYFLIAIILFSISLIFRSVDIYLCDFISFGTHFVWHILNSLVIYFLILFLFLTNRSSPKKPS